MLLIIETILVGKLDGNNTNCFNKVIIFTILYLIYNIVEFNNEIVPIPY